MIIIITPTKDQIVKGEVFEVCSNCSQLHPKVKGEGL